MFRTARVVRFDKRLDPYGGCHPPFTFNRAEPFSVFFGPFEPPLRSFLIQGTFVWTLFWCFTVSLSCASVSSFFLVDWEVSFAANHKTRPPARVQCSRPYQRHLVLPAAYILYFPFLVPRLYLKPPSSYIGGFFRWRPAPFPPLLFPPFGISPFSHRFILTSVCPSSLHGQTFSDDGSCLLGISGVPCHLFF